LGLAALVSLTLCCAAAQAAPPMPITAFRDAYVAAVKKSHPDDTVTVKADNAVDVTNAKGEATTTYLDHGYAFYKQDPSQLDTILAGEVAALDVAAGDATYTAEQLIVVVRPASFLPDGVKASKAPLHRPLAGDLIELVAADQPATWAFPTGAKLRRALKMNNDAIWERALANTLKQLPGPPPADKRRTLVALTTGHGVASSLLAEPDIWDTPAMQVGGAPVVAPVAKDMVLLTHLDDTKGIAGLREVAAKGAGDADALTQQLFVRRNGAWEVLPP
jgi:hypothetical protein